MLLTPLALGQAPQPATPASQVLWYDNPAQYRESEALPIGNGRLGAMIFGAADKETIQINEDACGWATKKTRACIRISASSRWRCRGPVGKRPAI